MIPMTSPAEMVERVARAIASKLETNPDEMIEDMSCVGSHPAWTEYEESARAAIEAMREPTEAMRDAGGVVAGSRRDDPDCPTAEAVWSAMISAALKE